MTRTSRTRIGRVFAACAIAVMSLFGVGTFSGVASAGVPTNPCEDYLSNLDLYLICLGGPAIVAEPPEVPAGSAVTITLTGWMPNSDVEVSIVTQDGQIIVVGTVTVDGDGTGQIVWNVPPDFPAGPVTVVGDGQDFDGAPATREDSVVVLQAGASTSSTTGTGDGGTGNLPVTGSDNGFLVGIGAALIVVGAAAVYGATRSRREEA